MRRVDGEYKFEEIKDENGYSYEDVVGFFVGNYELPEGDYDGCDWKENPAKILVKLTKRLMKVYSEKTHEIVEISDGSDTLWYGIIPYKLPKSKAKRKSK